MSNSKLATYARLSPYRYERQQKITGIIIHHMAGKLSASTCGGVFQWAEASANYGIGYDGTIGLYVPENCSAWSAASYYYDQRNISIELSNDSGAPNWHVSDLVINKCIDLCVDICKRNGIKKLNYTGDLSGNLLMHCWTASTACPGPYLKTKFKFIADEVNKKLAGYLDTPKLLGITAHTDGAITIRWSRVEGAYRYRVFRRLPGEKWTRLKDVAASSYKDTTCVGGTKYIYTVRCVGKDGKYVSSYDAKGLTAVARKVPKTFTVQTTKKNVKIYKSADTASAVVGKIAEKGVYTIVAQKNGMGKLKSGAGWINLADTKRI